MGHCCSASDCGRRAAPERRVRRDGRPWRPQPCWLSRPRSGRDETSRPGAIPWFRLASFARGSTDGGFGGFVVRSPSARCSATECGRRGSGEAGRRPCWLSRLRSGRDETSRPSRFVVSTRELRSRLNRRWGDCCSATDCGRRAPRLPARETWGVFSHCDPSVKGLIRRADRDRFCARAAVPP